MIMSNSIIVYNILLELNEKCFSSFCQLKDINHGYSCKLQKWYEHNFKILEWC